MHVWNALHAARWKYRTQKIGIFAPSDNFVRVYLRSWGMYQQSEKNLLNTDTSSTCTYNMVNFDLLTAEICWRVWGTPANFSGFCVLAASLHGTLVVAVSQTLRHWTEGATYIWQCDHLVGHWSTFLVSSIFFFFLPRLILAVGDWMSTILPHMVWPWSKFRMQVWNVLRATR